jgi:hypothetical protein
VATVANIGTPRSRTTKKSCKLQPESSVTPEQRAAMIALAEILRDIYVQQQQPTLTPTGKLLVQ